LSIKLEQAHLTIPAIVSAALLFLFFSCSHIGPASSNRFPLLPDSLSLEHSCFILSRYLINVEGDHDSMSLTSFYRVIDSTAAKMRRSPADAMTGPACVDSIVSVVYGTWRIAFDPADTVFKTLLPHLVYKNRKGACLGVSLIMLMLAERLGCPLYGVLLPGHFFCRYDDGKTHFTIEPNRAGFRHPEGYYATRYPAATRPWYDLSNLTKKEVVGVLCYNAGAVCLGQGRFGQAVSFFREAARRCGWWPEAAGNLGLALARSGRLDTAEIILGRLFQQHPDLDLCALNYGGVAAAAGRYAAAVEIYKKGLVCFPGDTGLLSGLSRAYERLGMRDSAEAVSPLNPPKGDFYRKGR
jgi:hypothetical protein